VETVTVSSGEPLTTPDGSLMRGHIRFVAPDLAVAPSDNYTLGGEAVAELVDGEFSITLVAPDATGINPTGWTYTIIGEFTNAPNWETFAVLTKDEPSVVLSDVIEAEAISPAFSTIYLRRDGGTMTGDLVLAGDPDQPLEATTKQYTDELVDTLTNTVTALDGQNVKLTQDQTVGGIKTFTSIPVGPSSDPITGNQLTRKTYVDAGDSAVQSNVEVVADNLATLDGEVATLDAQNVKLTGTQVITGAKTLTDNADVTMPNITELLGALVSTGIIRGGAVDPNLSNPIAIDIAPFVGYIVDHTANENVPSVVRVEKSTTSTIINANPSSPITWYYLNKDGTFGQQTTEPTAADRVARLQLGFSLQSGGLIIEVQTTHERITQKTGDWSRFLESLGSFSVRGEEMFVFANGANLSINTSAGRIFNRAIGLYNGPTLNYDRNVTTQDAVVQPSFRIGTRDPNSLTGSPTNVILPGNYDVNGVVTPVPNPTGSVTIQRVYYSPLSAPDNRFFIQYGQSVYASLTEGVNAIGTTNYQVNPLLKFTLLIGYIVVVKTATALNNPAQAIILPSERFRIR
jgi:hypothetical protein